MRWPLMEREHFSSLSLTIFLSPVASPSSSSVCLVHVHNVMMECQNKNEKKQTKKWPDVVVAMMMEDKSMVVCGWVYCAHKSTEKQ